MSTPPGIVGRIDESLAALRADDRRRRISLVGAVVVGVALVWVHWVGLFVAGALVGLTRRSLPRALLAGLVFGVGMLVVFFLTTPGVAPATVPSLAPLSYLTVVLALVGPTWGALVRGVA
jgi:hypothetical protein